MEIWWDMLYIGNTDNNIRGWFLNEINSLSILFKIIIIIIEDDHESNMCTSFDLFWWIKLNCFLQKNITIYVYDWIPNKTINASEF